jgi:spore coat protein U domain-containing protein, fimbrial subunit CupE1/2/3/6
MQKGRFTMFRKLAIAVATAALAGNAAPALAGTTTSNLSVTAAVASNCAISTSPVAFGAYDPVSTHSAGGVDLNGTGTVNVTCTKNSTGVFITLGLGANVSGSTRRMADPAPIVDYLTYELYHPSATTPAAACTFPGTTVWGTAGAGIFTPTGLSGWGANSAKSFNVCGTVTKGQDVGADSYSDTVVVTVTF